MKEKAEKEKKSKEDSPAPGKNRKSVAK